MKYLLREGFSLEVGDTVVVGPAEIEIEEYVYLLNQHKFEAVESLEVHEAVDADAKPKKKK